MSKHWPILTILVITLLAFYPVFGGKVPLNARNLVSFFSPWYYQKFEGFPTGVPSKPGMLDQIRLYYPYMRLTQESYRRGEFPLWNPYNFAGNPHMAEWQSGAFYPLHALLVILPLPVYWTLYQMSGFFLAGWFTFLFLRNLRVGKAAAILGSVSFMLSSFMTTWNMEVITAPHSILWMPLILLAVDKIVGWPQQYARHSRGFQPRVVVSQLRGSGVPADFSNEKSGSVRKTWWLVGLGGLVLSILSGYWQTTFYVMAVSAIYAMYRLITEKKLLITHYSLLIISWFFLALALTAFQLFPTWELYQRSSRPLVNSSPRLQEILTSYLLPIRHLVTLIIPDYFGHPTTRNYFANVGGGTYYEHALFFGTLPFLLAVLALVNWRRRSGDTWFWLIAGLGLGSLSFNLPWSRWIYDVKFPVLSTGIANRVLFVPAFAGAILAAFGLEAAGGKRSVKHAFFALGALVVLAAATFVFKNGLGAINPAWHPDLYLTSLRNMVIPATVLILAAVAILTGLPRMTVTILILAIFQNLYQHHKFTAFSETEFIYPETKVLSWLKNNAGFSRFLGYNGQFLGNDFATQFGIYTVEGYDSLNDSRRAALVQSAVDGKLNPDLPTSADVELDRNLKNERVIKLMKLFGVRYLVDYPEWLDVGPTAGLGRLPEESQKLVFQDEDWKIWEYLDAYPRAFLVGNWEVVNDGQETIDRLYGDDFNPLETLLLPEPLTDGFDISVDETGSVSVEKYTPTKIIFKTKSNNSQLLFLSDTYYPGWWYRVDNGEKQPVLAADYALRAAAVAAGEHTVTMWYFPDSFRNGLIAAGISVALAAVITSRRFWPNKVQEK